MSKITVRRSIEEKNKIAEEYWTGKYGRSELMRKYNIASRESLHKWITQYRKYGTTIDNRGKFSQGKGNFNRKKGLIPEQMTREELIEYVNATEDIKKLMVYLNRQKKNTK